MGNLLALQAESAKAMIAGHLVEFRLEDLAAPGGQAPYVALTIVLDVFFKGDPQELPHMLLGRDDPQDV